MIEYYDKEGRPLDRESGWRLFEDEEYRRIGLTEVGPYIVSTVWLGLDHGFGRGPPVIFETMVFTKSAWEADRSEEDHEQLLELDAKRYCTLQEAQDGHQETVLLIEATLDTEGPLRPQNGDSEGSEA